MPIQEVDISLVVQTNVNIVPSKVQGIKETIEQDGCLEYTEPPYCCHRNGRFYVRDGAHRLEAIKELGYTSLYVEFDLND